MQPQALSRDELLRLLAAARGKRERDWLIFLVMYNHALRVSEVLQIKGDDVQDGYLTVRRLKGSLKTVQPLIEDSEPLLNEKHSVINLGLKRAGNQSLFNLRRRRVGQLMDEYADRAGIPAHKQHPHVLKHTCITHLFNKLVPIECIREWAGHKSLASTGFYMRMSQDEVSAAVLEARKIEKD